MTETRDKVVIYTDGGCSPNPGPGAWAAVLISPAHGNAEKELSGFDRDSTNNRMEMTAAIEALASLRRPCKVTLYTDSQYLKKAFTDGWLKKWLANGWKSAGKKPVKNIDLWKKLVDLTGLHTVDWRWVRGHSDNRHNERCDEMVRREREKHGA